MQELLCYYDSLGFQMMTQISFVESFHSLPFFLAQLRLRGVCWSFYWSERILPLRLGRAAWGFINKQKMNIKTKMNKKNIAENIENILIFYIFECLLHII